MAEEQQARPYAARVVAQAQLSEAKAIARMFRSVGIMREAFSDPAEAARWDLEQQLLWRSEPWRQQSRSG